jgi:hypothetical protein
MNEFMGQQMGTIIIFTQCGIMHECVASHQICEHVFIFILYFYICDM